MCGITAVVGVPDARARAARAIATLEHRGPDAAGTWDDPAAGVALAFRRLSIIDLSSAGNQPMASADEQLQIVFNGEIYNYLELRRELSAYPFRTSTDTEVILAAYLRWGVDCLDHFVGMFAFALWDRRSSSLFAARDRFGVKPLFLADVERGGIAVASEIKALHALGVPAEPDEIAWASYLATGASDDGERTFWRSIRSLPAGHRLRWRSGVTEIDQWYDVARASGRELDARADAVVAEEYLALLRESIALRFRADVPVGINLSGGLDSSTLLAGVHAVQGDDSDVSAFTFVTGDPDYDELPWVRELLAETHHRSVVCTLRVEDVPALADDVQRYADEPFGGLPTLAYAVLFDRARDEGVTVLLDGQGMDEQWAGYDYYRALGDGPAPIVQGSTSSPTRIACLRPDFVAQAAVAPASETGFDVLRTAQLRDLCRVKLPRALRFNDRVSMRASRELREPFLDHRLVELALRQPPDRKVDADNGKVFLRSLVGRQLPGRVVEAPKRPLQTPQREWLRGPLRAWAVDLVEAALEAQPAWFDAPSVRAELSGFLDGRGDNSFFVWQWMSCGLLFDRRRVTA